LIRNRSQRSCWGNHVLGITAIEVETRDLSIYTHRKVTSAALFADKAMSTMPTYADALTIGPCSNVITNCINSSGYFMTRHTWVLKPWP
jgi:hypothetical protein